MKVRESYKYAIASPTSMGVRITPEDRMAVQNSNRFYMQVTSATLLLRAFLYSSRSRRPLESTWSFVIL